MSQTIGDDIIYDENECIEFIHDFVLGIKPDELDSL